MYKGKIVHIVGMLSSYVGELDQDEHPNGEDWIRIKNPCSMKITGSNQLMISKLGGVENMYRPYVDIKMPPDVAFEVRVVDKASVLYEAYIAQITQKKREHIVTPGEAGLKNVVVPIMTMDKAVKH